MTSSRCYRAEQLACGPVQLLLLNWGYSVLKPFSIKSHWWVLTTLSIHNSKNKVMLRLFHCFLLARDHSCLSHTSAVYKPGSLAHSQLFYSSLTSTGVHKLYSVFNRDNADGNASKVFPAPFCLLLKKPPQSIGFAACSSFSLYCSSSLRFTVSKQLCAL